MDKIAVRLYKSTKRIYLTDESDISKLILILRDYGRF